MNAIISFCHFCELHGPSVVFCTQTYCQQTSFESLKYAREQLRTSKEEENIDEEDYNNGWKYGALQCEDSTKPHGSSTTNMESCSACRSIPHNKAGYVSNDDDARVSYVSSQFPLKAELQSLIRQACTRSLSCEVCSGREGPIYFGDEARGHVLSYTFFLRDSQARGFQRWYSILILMKDKMFLLSSWSFLIYHIQRTIDYLQEASTKVYTSENGNQSKMVTVSLPSDGLRRQRGAGPPRPLPELVDNKEVWSQLHTSFTWLLKAGSLRLQEKLIEGPPLPTNCSELNEELSIRQLYQLFGGPTFRRLLHHMLIGQQLIIWGTQQLLVTSLVQSLKVFFPSWLYRGLSFTKQLTDVSNYNIIGMHSELKEIYIRDNINNDGIFTINLVIKDIYINTQKNDDKINTIIDGVSNMTVIGTTEKKIKGESHPINDIYKELLKYNIQVSEQVIACIRPPQIIGKIDAAATNPSISDSALLVLMVSIIEEWTNKVKVWLYIKNKHFNVDNSGTTSQGEGLSKQSITTSPSANKSYKQQVPNQSILSNVTSNKSYIQQYPSLPNQSASSNPSIQLYPSFSISSTSSMQTVGIATNKSTSLPPICPSSSSTSSITHPVMGSSPNPLQQLLMTVGVAEWDIPLLESWSKTFPA